MTETTETTDVVKAEVVDETPTANIYEENGITLYDTYQEFKERAKGRLTQEVQGVVWTRWTLGAHVKAVLETAHYGSHKMADLEADLGMKSKTLYACKTLFETYSRAQMEAKVMPKNLSFRALNYIARVPDEEKRDEYMDQVAAGEIKAEEIPKLEKGEATDTTTESSGTSNVAAEEKSTEEKAAAAIRRGIGAVDAPLDLVLGHMNDAETCLDNLDLVASDDDMYDAVQEELVTFKKKLVDLQPKVSSLVKRLSDAGA